MFWQSKKVIVILNSIKRRFTTRKPKMGAGESKTGSTKSIEQNASFPRMIISDPIPIESSDMTGSDERPNPRHIEKRTSYRDLKEPLDDEIEIFVRSRETSDGKNTIGTERHSQIEKFPSCNVRDNKATMKEHDRVDIRKRNDIEDAVNQAFCITQNIPDKGFKNEAKSVVESAVARSETEESGSNTDSSKSDTGSIKDNSVKTKKVLISDRVSHQLNKVSTMSRNFTGAVRLKFQKHKEMFQSARAMSTSKSDTATEIEQSGMQNAEVIPKREQYEDVQCETNNRSTSPEMSSRGLEYSTDSLDSNAILSVNDYEKTKEESSEKTQNDTQSESTESEMVKRFEVLDVSSEIHLTKEKSEDISVCIDGQSDSMIVAAESSHHDVDGVPCPCYVCRVDNGSHRRRSSSVPPRNRHPLPESTTTDVTTVISRHLSSPNMICDDCNDNKCHCVDNNSYSQTKGCNKATNHVPTPRVFPRGGFNAVDISDMEDDIEHYV